MIKKGNMEINSEAASKKYGYHYLDLRFANLVESYKGSQDLTYFAEGMAITFAIVALALIEDSFVLYYVALITFPVSCIFLILFFSHERKERKYWKDACAINPELKAKKK